MFTCICVGSRVHVSLVELGEDIGWKTAIDLLALSLEESGWYFVVAGDGVKWVFFRANIRKYFLTLLCLAKR